MKIRDVKAQPPVAKKIKKKLTIHEDTRIDNYFWLNQREDPEVIEHLKAENAYTDAIMEHTEEFQQNLYDEMVARIKKDDESVPYKKNGYYYYTRTEGEAEYPLFCRKKGSLDAEEEILLNIPELAEGEAYYSVGASEVSPNNKLLAYSVDNVSRRKYTIYIKNLKTGEIYPDKIENTSGSITWANDNKTIFYTKKDEQTLLPYQVYTHKIGKDVAKDKLVYEEKDNTFYTHCYKTKSEKYIIIGNSSTLTSEMRYIDADKPDSEFQLIAPRERGVEYNVAHYGESFYIYTNWNAQNFCLMKTPVTATDKRHWKMVIAPRKDVMLTGIDIFKEYLVTSEREKGLNNIRIQTWDGAQDYYIDFKEEVYDAWVSTNVDFDAEVLRYGYTSLTTPTSVFDINMRTKEPQLLKQQEVLGDFNKDNYKSKRIWVEARDGTQVPVSLVYNKNNAKLDGKSPLYIYAYGSYGNSIDAYFSSVRLSMLDRGIIYAIAHIRGGEELGRPWYEDGKLLKKKNTFTDFIDCTEYFVKNNLVAKDKVFACGGSAGGLLMGAVANMRPDLYTGIIAQVPFVDVVTTMLDETIPLTTGEFDEWGNPKDKTYYDYMLSYSPYDQVKAQDYPAMLVTTGLHDSQVQYWEPAKWVAKLREMKTDNNPVLLKIEMDYGHGGASGRFAKLKEVALEYAFMFDLLDIHE
ncbi:oligopeptidase B [Balneicella halophila]|uniref:Proline-specific endopeptidase n=1 Tax=Balneicella halophila TaxID=1537566 RepID=A0A7L4UQS6_BALHA|nr:S9 family peptidase [Balneicella halophila]PVX52125.1 oligopeptidase B [Balneicella halophila]